MNAWVPNFIENDGVRLAYYVAGPRDGIPLILIHGWPELAYSFSPIMPMLAAAGFRCIAPDLRGFGNSAVPRAVEDYGIAAMVDDVRALLDHHKLEKAIICGHDWGGIITWHVARMLEARASHIISICTPHVRRAPVDPIKIYKKRHGDAHYFVHFNERVGEADALFARDPDAFFRLMFRTVPDGAEAKSDFTYIPQNYEQFIDAGAPALKGQILNAEQLAVYSDAYERTGFSGGIALYRNTGANWEFAATLEDEITQPTLMISPDRDLLLPPSLTDPMVDMIPDLTREILHGSGHWAMWEQPEQLAHIMLGWLARQELG